MPEANQQQKQYIIDKLAAINPDLVFNNAATFGQKFAIYYTTPLGVETANFNPIGKYKDWETNWNDFTNVVDPILRYIRGAYGA